MNEQNKKAFVFDLDYTLLNTLLLKEEIGLAVAGDKNLSALEIVRASRNPETIKVVEKIMQKTLDFFYPNILENLEKLKEKGDMILLTKGAADFQLKKILNLPIDMFNFMITAETGEDKFEELLEISKKYEEVHFFNDNPKENDEVSEKLKTVILHPVKNNEFGYGEPIQKVLSDFLAEWYSLSLNFFNKKSLFFRLSSSLIKEY